MRAKPILLLLGIFIMSLNARAQLLAASWKNTVAKSDASASLISSVIDNSGNAFLLIYAPFGAELNGKPTGGDDSQFVLVKVAPDGNTLNSWAFDNDLRHTSYALGIDADGNVLIGGSFRDFFKLNGSLVATAGKIGSDIEQHPFLLKIDGSGKILWFRDFPCSSTGHVTGIATGEANNIYTIITYHDSLLLPGGAIISCKEWRTTQCLLALSADGGELWHKALCNYAYMSYNIPFAIYKPYQDCPAQLLMIVETLDEIVIDDSVVKNEIKWKPGKYLLQMMTDGNLVKVKKLGDFQRAELQQMEAVGNRIFISGVFHDSISIDGQVLYGNKFTAYVFDLDELLHLQQMRTLVGGTTYTWITNMKYLAGHGLVLLMSYADSFSIAGEKYISAPYSYPSPLVQQASGSVILTLSKDLAPGDMRYMDGWSFRVTNLSHRNNEITLYAEHKGYNPITDSAALHGVSLIKPEPFMKEDRWPAEGRAGMPPPVVYPNPFTGSCTVLFSTPVYGYTYKIFNTLGQLVDKVSVTPYSNSSLAVDLQQVPAGVYFLRLKNCCEDLYNIKLVKTE